MDLWLESKTFWKVAKKPNRNTGFGLDLYTPMEWWVVLFQSELHVGGRVWVSLKYMTDPSLHHIQVSWDNRKKMGNQEETLVT